MPSSRSRRLLFGALVGVALTASPLGCGTEAVGVETCRQVESARCRRGPDCALDLSKPPHEGDDVTACIRYYDDACLHGLASKNDPGGPQVAACVEAIQTDTTCTVVRQPESHPSCAFLVPLPTETPPPTVDAGTD